MPSPIRTVQPDGRSWHRASPARYWQPEYVSDSNRLEAFCTTLPVTINKAMVSPIARPAARMTPAAIPVFAAGSATPRYRPPAGTGPMLLRRSIYSPGTANSARVRSERDRRQNHQRQTRIPASRLAPGGCNLVNQRHQGSQPPKTVDHGRNTRQQFDQAR